MTNTLLKKKVTKKEIYNNYKEKYPNLDYIHKILLDFESFDNFNFRIKSPKYLSNNHRKLLVKQFCMNKVFGLLSTSLIYWEIAKYINNNKYGIVIPASYEILKYFESKKIKVNYFASRYSFLILKLKYFYKSFIFILKFLINKNKFKNSKEPYIFVFDINKDAIPRSSQELSYINWIKKNLSKDKKIYQDKYIVSNQSNLNIHFSQYKFPKLLNFKTHNKIFINFVIMSIHYFFSIFNHKSLSVFFFQEYFECKIIENIDEKNLADLYIFNNVSRNYRPMWTYNPKIINKTYYIFYGLNEFPIYFKKDKKILSNVGWSLMNWPIYLNWNKPFLKYLEISLKESSQKILYDEPIWYRDDNNKDNLSFENNLKTLALYDVTPIKSSLNFSWTKRSSFINNSTNVINFYKDILALKEKYNFNLIVKFKKNERDKSDLIYEEIFSDISNKKTFKFINTNKSPKIINSMVDAIISYPFTSAAYFNPRNLPTTYYDPSGLIDEINQINFGVNLIENFDKLENWVKSNLSD